MSQENPGPEKVFTQILRDVAAGEPAHPVDLGKGMRTPNRIALHRVLNYVADPQGAGRKPLFDYFQQQSEEHQGAEALTSSHAAWYYNAWGALLFFTWRWNDKPAFAGALELLASHLALENLMATPDEKDAQGRIKKPGIVVAPGGRCFLADGKTPNTTMADQRKIRNLTRAFLMGAAVKFPKAVEIALDWTGLWFLRKIPASVLVDVPLVAQHAELPGLISGLSVARGPRGHLAWFTPPVPMLRPAYWAAFIDGVESYGCQSYWPKGFTSLEYPEDMPPIPELGTEDSRVDLRSSNRKG